MSGKVYIYVLRDPRDNSIRYVGVITGFAPDSITTISWCATKAQVASGCKSRLGNCRFILVATQTVG